MTKYKTKIDVQTTTAAIGEAVVTSGALITRSRRDARFTGTQTSLGVTPKTIRSSCIALTRLATHASVQTPVINLSKQQNFKLSTKLDLNNCTRWKLHENWSIYWSIHLTVLVATSSNVLSHLMVIKLLQKNESSGTTQMNVLRAPPHRRRTNQILNIDAWNLGAGTEGKQRSLKIKYLNQTATFKTSLRSFVCHTEQVQADDLHII